MKETQKVFIGCLPAKTSPQEIESYFADFCSLSKLKIKYRSNNICAGYGHFMAHFKSNREKEALYSTRHYYQGRNLECRPYLTGQSLSNYQAEFNKRRVYVGNLPPFYNDLLLFELFSGFGTVERAYIANNPDKDGKIFGFVIFKEEGILNLVLETELEVGEYSLEIQKVTRNKLKKGAEELVMEKRMLQRVSISPVKKNRKVGSFGEREERFKKSKSGKFSTKEEFEFMKVGEVYNSITDNYMNRKIGSRDSPSGTRRDKEMNQARKLRRHEDKRKLNFGQEEDRFEMHDAYNQKGTRFARKNGTGNYYSSLDFDQPSPHNNPFYNRFYSFNRFNFKPFHQRQFEGCQPRLALGSMEELHFKNSSYFGNIASNRFREAKATRSRRKHKGVDPLQRRALNTNYCDNFSSLDCVLELSTDVKLNHTSLSNLRFNLAENSQRLEAKIQKNQKKQPEFVATFWPLKN
jgi:RNA recognition motif-containing protein